MEYYTITTNAGDQAIAQAIQSGTMTTFKSLAVGDGSGTYYDPGKAQTALRNEVWRGNAVSQLDPNNTKRVIVTATIPATVGGFTIREAGIFDTAGTLMVISKLPLSEKVAPESGASSDMVIRLYAEVADTGAVTVTVDPSAILAFKADVDAAKAKAAADLAAHVGDNVKHITAAERTQWNNKANVTDIPTSLKSPQSLTFTGGATGSYDGSTSKTVNIPQSLPANGGNAATVGGYSFEDGSADPSSSLPIGRVHFTWG